MRKRRSISCNAKLPDLGCRCLPHGLYPIVPTILSCMALWTTTVQDGCDYGRLTGEASIEQITGSDVFPFLEVGLYSYRAPIFYASENDWILAFTVDCQEYPPEAIDLWWRVGKIMTVISSILAGSLCLFLWFTTCVSFSKRTWRFCSVVAFLAAICRAGSFLFFWSSICQSKGSQCQLAFGSKVDLLGIILWLVIGFVLLGHYPNPKLRKMVADDDDDDDTDEENSQHSEEMTRLRSQKKKSQRQSRGSSRSSARQQAIQPYY